MSDHTAITHRFVMTSAAAVAATGIGSIATAPGRTLAAADPIHALIDAHRAAHAAQLALGDLEETLPMHRRQTEFYGGEPPTIVESDDPRWIAAQQALFEAYRDDDAALLALFTTAPSSLGGAAALLRYLDEAGGPEATNFFNRGGPDVYNAGQEFFGHLAEALTALAASSRPALS